MHVPIKLSASTGKRVRSRLLASSPNCDSPVKFPTTKKWLGTGRKQKLACRCVICTTERASTTVVAMIPVLVVMKDPRSYEEASMTCSPIQLCGLPRKNLRGNSLRVHECPEQTLLRFLNKRGIEAQKLSSVSDAPPGFLEPFLFYRSHQTSSASF